MTTDILKDLRSRARAFLRTKHGSAEEKEALQKWRDLCKTEEEEQIPISVYLRRKQEAKVAAKKASRRKKYIPQEVNHERKKEAQTAPKTEKQRGKKRVRPNWWENY